MLGTDPFYYTTTQFVSDGVTRYMMSDSPQTGNPANSPSATSIDYREYFTAYLVANYPDGSIYAIANRKWDVNFWADTNNPVTGVTVIRAPNGTTVGSLSYSNANPPKTVGPFATDNQSLQ